MIHTSSALGVIVVVELKLLVALIAAEDAGVVRLLCILEAPPIGSTMASMLIDRLVRSMYDITHETKIINPT